MNLAGLTSNGSKPVTERTSCIDSLHVGICLVDWIRRLITQNSLSKPDTTEIVLQAHNVVLAEVIAALYLDEDHFQISGVFDSMRRADRNINILAGVKPDFLIVERDFRLALHNDPVFCAARVFLITQPFARQNFDAFDFESLALVENCEIAPRPFVISRGIIFCG